MNTKARHEGSIVESYIVDKCWTFFSRYLKEDIETRFSRPEWNMNKKDNKDKKPKLAEVG